MDKDRIAGSIKETAGKILGDQNLEADGKAQNAAGKIQNAVGGAKDAARELADKA